MADREAANTAKATIRVCLDVNIWVAHQLAVQNDRKGGSSSALVQIVRDMACEAGPVQLAMSWEMLGTLEDVLSRLGFRQQSSAEFIAGLIGIMKAGPEQFDPYLLPEGGRSLPLKDVEDAGILASSIAARVDILVTNNLDDFAIKDSERIDTRQINRHGKRPRQLYALIYERDDGVSMVIAHPIDAIGWLRHGVRPTPDAVRNMSPTLDAS